MYRLVGSILAFTLVGISAFCGDYTSLEPAQPEIHISEYPSTPRTMFSDPPTTGPPLREPDMGWVADALTSMTLDEKIGQMIITSYHYSGEALIDNYHVGGFIFLGNGQDAGNIVSSVNRLQNYSSFPSYDRIIVLGYDWYKIASSTHTSLIYDLCALDVPVMYVGFGAPYHYLQIPGVDAFYCGYASVPAMQEVAVEVLTGERTARGELPVIVEGINGYPLFQGLLMH